MKANNNEVVKMVMDSLGRISDENIVVFVTKANGEILLRTVPCDEENCIKAIGLASNLFNIFTDPKIFDEETMGATIIDPYLGRVYSKGFLKDGFSITEKMKTISNGDSVEDLMIAALSDEGQEIMAEHTQDHEDCKSPLISVPIK